MGRGYKKSERQPHKMYSKDLIKKAVQDVKNGMTFRSAAEKYGVTASVIHRHVKKPNTRKIGRPTVLNIELENMLIDKINICAEWGYPLDELDLRLLVKSYLDILGKTVRVFKDNLPGRDFASGFLLRHKDKISKRLCQNIKRSRAAVSPEIINYYFDHLEQSLDGVPPMNIVNYDETNLSDDAGRKKVIVKRGCKYPERVMNTSKSSTSIMFAVTGDGNLLPTYTVYKALHIYNTWTERGPKGAYYGRSKSGWFDALCFSDWVEKIALPYFRKCVGKKVLIGDNLSSHLSIDLIRKCEEQNISFVFLPANSTHLTQPLDVSFFRPLKEHWRRILHEYKKGEGRTETTVPKTKFPQLLKQLVEKLKENAAKNIASGFRKTGIIPLDRNEVLNVIPPNPSLNEEHEEALNNSFVTLLKEMRYEKPTIKRKKKINVEPGKSVAGQPENSGHSEDETDSEAQTVEPEQDCDETSSYESLPSFNYKKLKTDAPKTDDNDSDTIPLVQLLKKAEDDSATNFVKRNNKTFYNVKPVKTLCDINASDWVLVAFATDKGLEKFYIGIVQEIKENKFIGSFLRNKPTKNECGYWYIWPAVNDISEFEFNAIVGKLEKPKETRLGLRFALNFNSFQ